MGLLDYLKQGQTALTNATGMDWNKIQADPGANAQALMGGQPMNPQGLLNNAYGEGTNTFANETGSYPQNITPQQQGQVTYGPQIGPNMGQVNQYSSEEPQLQVGGHSGQEPVNPNFNNRITQPQVGSMLMGSPAPYVAPSEYTTQVDDTDYSQQGVISNPPPAQTTPFSFPPGILGEAFDPSMTEEEKRAREAAKANIPWYLGGTGGK